MTDNKNELLFAAILFLPMIIGGAIGVYYGNIGIMLGSSVIGIFLAKLYLGTGGK